jgi:multiple sugar transport system permease protein
MKIKVNFNLPATVVVAVLGTFSLFPLFWMVRSSLMSNIEIFQYPPLLLPKEWRWENYAHAFTLLPFHRYFLNTMIIAIPAVVGVLVTSSMAAYAFARLEFPGKDFIFSCVIASMLMPMACTIIPIFVGWAELGLIDSFWPLIIPPFLGGGGVNIFLTRQFLRTIPRELDEAALIDGASHVRVMTSILLPLVKPVLITVGLFTFVFNWNDLLGPILYLNSSDNNTISQGLANFRSGFGTDYRSIMAICTLTVSPVVVVFLIGQKYFVEGIALSGLKA